jgi:probable DNA metabolism protein
MKTFLINNSVNGLLSALFISFTENIFPDDVVDKNTYQPRIDSVCIDIIEENTNVERVKNGLYKYGGNDIIALLKICLKSCDKNALNVAFNYGYLTLKKRTDISNRLEFREVSDFSFIIQKVLHERHIMTGFLRFKQSEKGVLYAQYSPDNDISDLIAPHFLRRLGKLPFVIHDIKRGVVVISDGDKLKTTHTDLPVSFTPSENEQSFNQLWKRYYKEINIKERKNLRQQDHFIPRRYRAYAFETWE